MQQTPKFRPVDSGAPDFEHRLERAFLDMERALGVRITVHDVAGVFLRGDGTPILTRERGFHMHEYCRHGRESRFNKIDQMCMQDCRIIANRRIRSTRQPQVGHCWRGVAQVVIPLERGESWIGSLFAGPFRTGDAPEYLPDATAELHAKLPVLDDLRARELVSVLSTFSKGIIQQLDEFLHETPEPSDRPQAIRRFLHYSASKQHVTLDHLANVLHLSPSRTSHVVRESFGVSFKELLLKERLKKACYLLETTTYPIAQVAELTGFTTEYYFSRLFAKKLSASPSAYRKSVIAGVRRRRGAAASVVGASVVEAPIVEVPVVGLPAVRSRTDGVELASPAEWYDRELTER